jgi:riboflavin synthase
MHVFTGIVEAAGRVVACTSRATGVRMCVDAAALDLADVRIGDSIAVAGCCLTVVELAPPWLHFDVSGETLACTKGFAVNDSVNLEKALRLSDRLGGHLMSGHVDGVGSVTRCHATGSDRDGNWHLEVDVPPTLASYIAPKGSVAVDGVSLTTNAVRGSRFEVNLIPHTRAVTTLAHLALGAKVNLEVDMLARYVQQLLRSANG